MHNDCGHNQNSKAYRLFDPIKNKIVVSRDVVFLENSQVKKMDIVDPFNIITDNSLKVDNDVDAVKHELPIDECEMEVNSSNSNSNDSNDSDVDRFVVNNAGNIPEVLPMLEILEPRRSARLPKPIQMNDFVTYM